MSFAFTLTCQVVGGPASTVKTETFTVSIASECEPTTDPSFTTLDIRMVQPYDNGVPAVLFPESSVPVTKAAYSNVNCGSPTYTLVNNMPVSSNFPMITLDGDHATTLELKGKGTDIQ